MRSLNIVQGYKGLYVDSLDKRLVAVEKNEDKSVIVISKIMNPGDCIGDIPEQYHPTDEVPLKFYANFSTHGCGCRYYTAVVHLENGKMPDKFPNGLKGLVTGKPSFHIPEGREAEAYERLSRQFGAQVNEDVLLRMIEGRYLEPKHHLSCRVNELGARAYAWKDAKGLLLRATYVCGFGDVNDQRLRDASEVYKLVKEIPLDEIPNVNESPLTKAREGHKTAMQMLGVICSLRGNLPAIIIR